MSYSAAQGGSEPWRALHNTGNENQQVRVLRNSEELPSCKFCSGAISTERLSLLTSNTCTSLTDQAIHS